MVSPTSWSSISEFFPLCGSSEETLVSVCRSLWGWKDCALCANQGNCTRLNTCPWNLRKCVEPYLQYYYETTSLCTSDDWDKPYQALRSHTDLQKLFELINRYPDQPKSEVIAKHFANHSESSKLTSTNKNKALDIALSALVMVPISERNRFLNQYSVPTPPESWQDWQSARHVLHNAVKVGPALSNEEVRSVTCKLSAYKLETCGIKLLGTDDLRQHLMYDQKHLYIFRHPGFLKASLMTRNCHASTDPLLSRQLALDTLYTLRFILYKWDDTRSCAMAANNKIDLSCLGLDEYDYSEDGDHDKSEQYPYWGGRLQRLAQVLDESTADGRIRAWVKRRSGKEYIMFVTMVGVIVAIVGAIVGPWMQSQENAKAAVLLSEGGNASRNSN